MYIISSCLLGEKCRYDGESSKNENVIEFSKKIEYISVCPETLGGLSIPRDPCEIKEGRIVSEYGTDHTQEFTIGAEKTLDIAKEKGILRAILKSKSPSCGNGFVYDGSFTKKLVQGQGLTAKLLLKNNIRVYSEVDFRISIEK